ncbi:MAG: carbamoyltransferase C-terminal domain-containing protein [Gemmatimonadota bacterium]
MLTLGLGTEGDSGAAVLHDGRFISAINEERLSRMKLVEGFPRGSIRETLRIAGATAADLDAVLVGSTRDLFIDELRPFDGWFQHWDHSGGVGGTIKKAAAKFSRHRERFPILEAGYYALLTPTFLHRRRALRRLLRQEIGIRCPIVFVDHHLAHVASAYYTSGYDDALIVSLDGGGDGKSGLIYESRGGALQPLHSISAYNSLGNYYAYATHLCGFKAMKHEGKITGLAAHGEPRYLDILRSLVDEKDGTIVNRGGLVFRAAIEDLERRLPPDWRREDLAASIQRHFEEVVGRVVGFWARKTGHRDVAVAGGVFANVRVNQAVHELPEVDRLFVHPAMADGGLPGGAALAACLPGILDRPMPAPREPLRDVYLGPDLGEAEIDAALQAHGVSPVEDMGDQDLAVAELLAEGYVVARAQGRMEYGPRALGNRSILYQPADRAVNDWLNQNLRRTEFMPFAPSVLAEECGRCFENTEGAEFAAEFMTVTFDCTPFTRASMEGVVHLDGTARPQLVRSDRNPGFHRIITAFAQRTGLPAVINTSFNMHEEPIVSNADDCVRAFLDGNLDFLAIGDRLVRHPQGARHELKPVRGEQHASVGRTSEPTE